MRFPSMTLGARTLLENFGVYHLVRLEADPETQDLAAAFLEAQNRLLAIITHHGASEGAAGKALAIRDAADDRLDHAVRSLSLAILQKTNGRRSGQLWQNYFPTGLVAVVNAPLEAEIQRVGAILAKLGQETDTILATHRTEIESAVAELRAAIDSHREAQSDVVRAFGLVQTEKLYWLDAYRRSHRALAFRFYQDANRAEEYFHPTPREGRGDQVTDNGTRGGTPSGASSGGSAVAPRVEVNTGQPATT